MSKKKYYTVEFTIVMGAWGENEDEAYEELMNELLEISNTALKYL